MRLLQFQTQVAKIEDERFGKELSFLDHLRSNAARAMAEKWLEESSRYKRIEPENKDDPFAPIIHRWTIGTEDNVDAIADREADMEKARQEGREQAAQLLETRANRYDGLEGRCAHVISFELRDRANQIRELNSAGRSQ